MITDDASKSHKEIALYYLELQQKAHLSNRRMRPYYARLAHQHGVTHREIGEVYGVTEAAIRAMIKKFATCKECAGHIPQGTYCPACGLYDAGGY